MGARRRALANPGKKKGKPTPGFPSEAIFGARHQWPSSVTVVLVGHVPAIEQQRVSEHYLVATIRVRTSRPPSRWDRSEGNGSVASLRGAALMSRARRGIVAALLVVVLLSMERGAAERFAVTVIAASEGAVVVSRAERSLEAFELVASQLVDASTGTRERARPLRPDD